jgi:hypothetical protein
MTNSGLVLFILTVFFALLLAGLLGSVIGQTAHGDASMGLAINWIYACILVCLEWICMSGLLLVASDQSVLPGWSSVAAVFLCPPSGAAALAALYLLDATPARWPMAIPVGVPLLLAGYVLALYQPFLRGSVAATPVSIGVWAVVLALCIPILPVLSRRFEEQDRQKAERQHQAARAEAEASTRRREENLAFLKTMTPDKPLTDWYKMLEPASGVRQEALAALREVPRRQRDIEELLPNGIPFYMAMVPDLDLRPTPELCKAVHAYLAFVADSKKAAGQAPFPYQADDYIDNSLESVRWFTAHGCGCDESIAAIEKNVRTHYLDSGARVKFLALLASLKQPR